MIDQDREDYTNEQDKKHYRTTENICSCGRNLENLNEYIDKQSFRYQQAKHNLCIDCLENVITQHRKDK